jgi:aspartate/glutamate racemase
MRTREEIDQEYSQVAIMLGHKTRVMAQAQAEADRLKAEIAESTKRLLELNAEGLALPAERLNAVELEAVLPAEPQA